VKWRIYIPVLLLIVPLQTTAAHFLSFHGIKPDLGLIAVCLIGFRAGEIDGLGMGIATGLLLDLFSGGPIPANLLTKPIAGWVAGRVGKTVHHLNLFSSMAILAGISLVCGFLIYFLLQLFSVGMETMQAFRWIILPQAVYDGIAGALLLSLIPGQAAPEKVWE
jgi:rod shape-determining protein MreD